MEDTRKPYYANNAANRERGRKWVLVLATGEIEHCRLRGVAQITFATNDVTVMTTTKATIT
jgi:hypothetical protein